LEASSAPFRHNLEPLAGQWRVGPWTAEGRIDHVSERRFLLWRARANDVAGAPRDVMGFRADTCRALLDHGIDVLDVAIEGTRAELLTTWARPVDFEALERAEVQPLLSTLLSALGRLAEYGFRLEELTAAHLGRDEDDRFIIAPPACLLPPPVDHDSDIPPGFAETLEALASCADEDTAFRLRAAATAILSGSVVSLDAVSSVALGTAGADTATRTGPVRDDHARVREVRSLLETHTIVEVTGPEASGKSSTLDAVGAALRASGEITHRIDEWSFFPRSRRKGSSREPVLPVGIWLLDDVGEHPGVYAALASHLASGEGARVVWTLCSPTAEPSYLAAVRTRATSGTGTVSLTGAGDPGSRLSRIAGRIGADDDGGPDKVFASISNALEPEERQILQLVAVAGTALPLRTLETVFSGEGRALYRRLHHLSAPGLLAIDYRAMPPVGELSVAVSFAGASLRRRFYDGIDPDRRRNLHRTIARVSETSPGFPPMLVAHHLLAAGEDEAALSAGLAFLRESTPEDRAPFLEQLRSLIFDDGRDRFLSYEDHLFAAVRVAGDLFARGRRAEAEQLLVQAREAPADSEDVRVNASLIGETMRLLADTWAARSNYTQALDLLRETREELGPYLSLADQALLMNEIGWLQYRLGDYDRSVESCKLSLNTINPNEHPLVVAQALNLMGVIHFNTSRYDEAISYYEQSAILREKEGARNALAGSYNNLALAYQAKGEYDKALDSYDRSLAIKKEQNNEAGIAAGYLNQALLYLEVHNFDEAARKCRESLEIATRMGITQLTAENHSTLGDIALTRGRYEEAENAYRKSLALARSLETTNEEMGALRRLAKLYLDTDRPEEAREAVEAAVGLAQQIGSKYETAQIENILGDLELAEGRYAEAIDHFEKAASLYATVSKYPLAATALARIGHAHAHNGNSFEARHYLDRATELIKSRIGHEIPDEIVTLQQMLSEQPMRPEPGERGTDDRKLLYAFYELSTLPDYADDKTSLFKRIVNVFSDLANASNCWLVLRTEGDSFVEIDARGEQRAIESSAARALCTRSLQLGTLLHSASEEAADVRDALDLPAERGLVCVPMKSMGRSLGCVMAQVPAAALPLTKDESNFLSSLGRHVAGALRLTYHLEEHAHKEETLEMEFQSLKEQVVDEYRLGNLVGKDESMKKIFRTLDKVKEMDTGILIFGESGTGKTELARAIHYSSPRRKQNFQQIHCAEIPTNLLESELFGHEKGAFTGAVQRKLGRCEVADGGTIFLDDVNVMPIDTQAKLLQYLESKSFNRLGGTQKITTDVRIIAASNEDPEMLVARGRFREDLYYRLKVIQVELPPLRDRPEDMIAIAQAFLKRRCQAQGKPLKTLAAESIRLFQRYPWPGNVRELQNILEQVVLLSDATIIEPVSLPEDFLKRVAGPGRYSRQTLEALAEQMVSTDDYSEANPLMPQMEALLARKMADHMDSKGKAASMLGITKPTLYNRLRGYDKLN